MANKKFNREQMQRCLDVLEELAHSGLSTQKFAQAMQEHHVFSFNSE